MNKLFFASIQLKVFAVVFAVTTTIVVVLTVYFPHRQIAAGRVALQQKALTYGKLTGHEVEPAIAFGDRETAREVFAAMRSDPEIRSLALYSSDGALLQMDGEARPTMPDVLATATVRATRNGVISVTPVFSREGPRGTLTIELSTAALDAEQASIERVAVALGMMMLTIGFVAAWLIGRSLGRRLRAVAAAATTVASGNLSAPKLDASSHDEVGQLAGSFNVMVANVERLMAKIEQTGQDEKTRLDELVKLRTRELDARNADMKRVLANVGQGLVTVDRDGTMGAERSATLDAWLGPAATTAKFVEVLAKVDPGAAEWFELGWDMMLDNVLPMEVSLEQLPRRLVVSGRHLSIDYKPIVDADALSHVLVVVSDVTAEVERARADVASREMVVVFEHIMKDRVGFREFFDDTSELVSKITSDIEAELAVRKRWIHTIKGNAATFGLASIADACHELETRIAEDGGELSRGDLELLTDPWSNIAPKIARLLGEDGDPHIELTVDDYRAVLEALASGASRRHVVDLISRWMFEPSARRFERIGEQARSLGLRLEKGNIDIAIDAGGVRLDTESAASFWGAFTHVVRNAVDHGLETPAERAERGKSPVGSLSLRSYYVEDAVVIELADDGRGLDWERIRARASAAGLPSATEEDLVAAIVRDGFSTREAVSEYSGRGVGLAAIAEECGKLGGTMLIESRPNEGTRLRFRLPRRKNPQRTDTRTNAFGQPALA